MCAQGENPTPYPLVTIRDTQVRSLRSQIVEGMEYHIYVALPEGYQTSLESYPALYLLDAWHAFGTFVGAYSLHFGWGLVPKLVLFGISHPGTSVQDHLFSRSRDFIPTKLSIAQVLARHGPVFASITPISGGAPNFLRFLRQELFPFTEREYRLVPSDRGLFGYSYGGLFALYALFTAPELFSAILSAVRQAGGMTTRSFAMKPRMRRTTPRCPPGSTPRWEAQRVICRFRRGSDCEILYSAGAIVACTCRRSCFLARTISRAMHWPTCMP